MRAEDLLLELRLANEDVVKQRNNHDGEPTLAAVDRLTDAGDAYLAAMKQRVPA